MKLLFLGNSITRHSQKTEIGWDGDYGMAASAPENDYVHVLCRMLENRGKHAVFRAVNVSAIEVDPCEETLNGIKQHVPFGADAVIIRLGENVPEEKADAFAAVFSSLIRCFAGSEVFVVSSFWKKPKVEEAMKNAAGLCGVPFVSLEKVRGEEYQAIGEFGHEGVAAHPSDKGMRAIAQTVFDAMERRGMLSAPVIPDFIDGEKEKTDYRVTVDGREIRCHRCRVSAMPFNTVWPGHQRPLPQTEVSSFISFDMDASADIRVKLARRPSDAAVRPLRAGIECDVLGDEVFFTLKKPGQYVLEIDGRQNVLHIFANPKDSFDIESASYRFEHGVFDAGKITLKSGESVYIGADAVVYGEIVSTDSENIRIFGRGILDGSKFNRKTADCDIGGDGLINFARCRNVTVDGVILRDSCMWTLTAIHCENLTCRSVKVIGMWRYNSDGFDFVNSRGVHVSDCFLRTFDDGIVLKGLQGLDTVNVEDHLIENCVVWCDWGGALEIGAETVADEYRNIVFRHCDVIRTDQGALRIHSGDRAEIHDVTYEDITVEYSKYDRRAVYQESDDMVYEPGDVPAHDAFIKAWMYCGVWSDYNLLGHVHDITYRNIRLFTDDAVPMPEIVFNGGDETHPMENVTVEDVFLNGKKLNPTVSTNAFTRNIVCR